MNIVQIVYFIGFTDFEQIESSGIPLVDQIEDFRTIFGQSVHGHVISRNRRQRCRRLDQREERKQRISRWPSSTTHAHPTLKPTDTNKDKEEIFIDCFLFLA